MLWIFSNKMTKLIFIYYSNISLRQLREKTVSIILELDMSKKPKSTKLFVANLSSRVFFSITLLNLSRSQKLNFSASLIAMAKSLISSSEMLEKENVMHSSNMMISETLKTHLRSYKVTTYMEGDYV